MDQWKKLLGATLETWAHHLLYMRRVYPRETFVPTSFLGVRCQANRHPGVVSYIRDSIEVGVPALISGVADEISLVIIESDELMGSTTELEKYCLSFRAIADSWENDSQFPELMAYMERSMRDLVLQIHSMESSRASLSETCSFTISLHIPEENKSCKELNQAFAQGTWSAYDKDGCGKTSAVTEIIRPLHEVSTPICELNFSLRKPDNRKPPPT